MEINSKYEITYGENNIGAAMLTKEGIRYRLKAEVCCSELPSVFRLAAVCGFKTAVLGVMVPDNDRYVYNKLFTADELRRLELYGVDGFTICEAAAGQVPYRSIMSDEWCTAVGAAEFFEEGEFKRIFSACKEVFYRRKEDVLYLAVPIVKGQEFPVMPVFCLGEPQKIGEKLCLVFKIRGGKLLF